MVITFNLSNFMDGVVAPAEPLGPSVLPVVVVSAEAEQHVVTREYRKTHAILAVKSVSTGKVLCATDHFLLMSINEPDQERTSFVLSFGDPTLYTGLGRNPRIFSYGGLLADSLSSGPNISQWQWMYDNYYRGTRCARAQALVELSTRDFVRKGLMLSSALSMDATRPRVASFSFNMFVVKER